MINKCDTQSTATLLTPPEGQQPSRWAKYAVAFQPRSVFAGPQPQDGTHSRLEIHIQKISRDI